MNDSWVLKRTPDGSPVARGVHVRLKPITDERKLRLARERFSKKEFTSDEVVPNAIWEVATNVWCSYEPKAEGTPGFIQDDGFKFYEPLPAPVYTRSGVLYPQED